MLNSTKYYGNINSMQSGILTTTPAQSSVENAFKAVDITLNILDSPIEGYVFVTDSTGFVVAIRTIKK